MERQVTDMNPEELRELFPIFLVRHDDNWDTQYTAMEKALKKTLRAFAAARVSHVDSTAIPGILAKNIVDIMTELAPGEGMERAAETIGNLGFVRKYTEPGRIFLRLGCTEEGFAKEAFHLYLRYRGGCDELCFRDCLRENPALASEYEALKQQLWRQYEHGRDAYTGGKTAFIWKWTKTVKIEYAGRYH